MLILSQRREIINFSPSNYNIFYLIIFNASLVVLSLSNLLIINTIIATRINTIAYKIIFLFQSPTARFSPAKVDEI